MRPTHVNTMTPATCPTTMYHTAIANSPPTRVPKDREINPLILDPVVGLIPRITVMVIHTPRYSVKKSQLEAKYAGIVPASVAQAARNPNCES
jgi:hypothetical protein